VVIQKTFPSYKPAVQFDYILLKKPCSQTKELQKIVTSQISLPASSMSDHCPIGAEISLA